ncbi:hypothetical protein GCM10009096_01640 [Parasphingorhabdus litoris]|uniref:DUF7007 domain-containing protein n=1 Tax=Parasphingorhabdus litoris TaxID=394733 RepID=A0ABN1A0R7_9SPHN|nr:hypothetical protein [Parasphingorhabdus litoris]
MQHPIYPDEAMGSPWGKPERQIWITQEILSISTGMGGGYFVTGNSFSQIPAYWRMHAVIGAAGWGTNWFENETGANGIIITFPGLFSQQQLASALDYADRHGLMDIASEGPKSKKSGE